MGFLMAFGHHVGILLLFIAAFMWSFFVLFFTFDKQIISFFFFKFEFVFRIKIPIFWDLSKPMGFVEL